MTDQINKELLKLQEELSKFEGSVGQIIKSNELTDNLINSSKELQNKIVHFSENIKEMFSEYMNKTYSYTEKNLSELYEKFQERIKHEDLILEQFSKLTMQNEKATEEYLQKVSEITNTTITEFYNQTVAVLNEEKEYIQVQIEKLTHDIEKLMQEHLNRLKTEQEILDNYLELAKETALLTETIKNIDFPKRLEAIHTKIEEENAKTKNDIDKLQLVLNKNNTLLNENQQNIQKIQSNTENILNDPTNKKILSLTEKIATDPKLGLIYEKTNILTKKLNTTRTWAFLTFLLLLLGLGFSVLTILTLYPNFFDRLLSVLNLK